MILEKLKVTKEILEKSIISCKDGGVGHFLNIVADKVYNNKIDFTEFKTESWERARRLVLQKNPELDLRTCRTKDAEEQVKREVA